MKGLPEKMKAEEGATLGTRTVISTGTKIGSASEERNATDNEKRTVSVRKSVNGNVRENVKGNAKRSEIRNVRRKDKERRINKETGIVIATIIARATGTAPNASDF